MCVCGVCLVCECDYAGRYAVLDSVCLCAWRVCLSCVSMCLSCVSMYMCMCEWVWCVGISVCVGVHACTCILGGWDLDTETGRMPCDSNRIRGQK